jgi:hypothetical protein
MVCRRCRRGLLRRVSRASRAPPPPCARPHAPRCALHSSQHLGIVGDKALARMKYMGLCRNKLSALPPKISIMVSLVEVRCTDNWLKNLPEVRRLSVCSCVSAVHSVKALGLWLAPQLRSAYGGIARARVVSDWCLLRVRGSRS